MTGGTSLEDLPAAERSVAVTRHRIRWFAGCGLAGALICGGLAYAVTPLLPTTYTAESLVVVRSPSEITVFGSSDSAGVSSISLSAAQVLRSQEVAIAASDALDGRLTPAEVRDQTTITTGQGSPVVTVEATAATAAQAQELANAVPRAYLRVESGGYADRADRTETALGGLREIQADRLLDVQEALSRKAQAVRDAAPVLASPADTANWVQATLETDIEYQRLQNEAAGLTARIAETDDAIQQSAVDFSILESGVDRIIDAQLPQTSTSPVPARNLVAGVIVGSLLGAALAWQITERRRALDPATAAVALGAPLLGRFGPERQLRRFPRFVDFSTDATPGNELKVLTSSLLISAHRRNVGAVVVSSAHSHEGTTVLAANLAAAADYTGHPVALVDASTNANTVSAVFGLDEEPGLSEVLDGGPLTNSLQRVGYDDARDLLVVPAGVGGWRNEPGRRLSENRRRAWAATFNGGSELTAIVDAPPVNDHPLALQLAGNGALVVVVSPRTSLTDLEVIRNRAEVAEVAVLGFILNEFRTSKRGTRPMREALRTHRRDRDRRASEDRQVEMSAGT